MLSMGGPLPVIHEEKAPTTASNLTLIRRMKSIIEEEYEQIVVDIPAEYTKQTVAESRPSEKSVQDEREKTAEISI